MSSICNGKFENDDSTCDEVQSEDSESEFDPADFPMHDHVEEITKVIASHDVVSYKNALILNNALQNFSMSLRNKLQNILRKCNDKYLRNQELLLEAKSGEGRSNFDYSQCGAPYFKDVSFYRSPNNSDYDRRKLQLREFFPLDVECIVQHHWVARDKICLIQGIKRQVLSYLDAQEKKKNSKLNVKKEKGTETITKTLLEIADDNIKRHSFRLSELLPQTGNDFKINWYRISTEELDSRHSENECYAMWNAYLRPELSRKEWSSEEEDKLLDLVSIFNCQEWDKIAKEMGNRSEYQCFLHFQTVVCRKLNCKYQKWTNEDDQMLLKAVETSSIGPVIYWSKVMSYFPHKNRKQVYTRFKYSLDPQINKGQFTREEDCILMAAVQEYGETNFSCIPISLFPGRTAVQIRNRYMNVLRHAKTQRYWTVEDDKKLLQLVEEYGASDWAKISKILKVHSRMSCRTRYIVIQKYFEKNPTAKVEDIPRKKKGVSSDISMENWADKIADLKANGDAKAKELEYRRKKLKERMNHTYREKLRLIERKYHDFFKYSYDFSLTFPTERNKACKNMKFLVEQLKTPLTLSKINRRGKRFTKDEINCFKESLKNSFRVKVNINNSDLKSRSYLPISWCTVIGLRGLYILHEEYKNKYQEKRICVNVTNGALARFRLRFLLIFYMTALLNKFNPSNLTSNPIYKIRFVPADNSHSAEDEVKGKGKKRNKSIKNDSRKCLALQTSSKRKVIESNLKIKNTKKQKF